MLKKTLIAVAAISLMAFGATDAFAGKGGGGHGGGGGGGHHGGGGAHGGGGGKHGGGGHYGGGGGKHGGGYHGGGHHRGHSSNRYSSWWLSYSRYPSCYYEARIVRVKVRGRHGRPYYKRVWRDVRVCN